MKTSRPHARVLVLAAVLACPVGAGPAAAQQAPTQQPAAQQPGAPALAARADAPAPVLVIDAPRIDLGVIQEGRDAVATFTLKNTGNAELRILSARPG